MCCKENVGMFVAACDIEVKFSEAADIFDDLVEEVELEGW